MLRANKLQYITFKNRYLSKRLVAKALVILIKPYKKRLAE